jgi:hypothetical protein
VELKEARTTLPEKEARPFPRAQRMIDEVIGWEVNILGSMLMF